MDNCRRRCRTRHYNVWLTNWLIQTGARRAYGRSTETYIILCIWLLAMWGTAANTRFSNGGFWSFISYRKTDELTELRNDIRPTDDMFNRTIACGVLYLAKKPVADRRLWHVYWHAVFWNQTQYFRNHRQYSTGFERMKCDWLRVGSNSLQLAPFRNFKQ